MIITEHGWWRSLCWVIEGGEGGGGGGVGGRAAGSGSGRSELLGRVRADGGRVLAVVGGGRGNGGGQRGRLC